MINVAKIISFLLSPLFILLPVPYILVEKVSSNHQYALKWTIFSYIFVLAVAVFILIGVKLKIFSNFDVSRKEQRPILFLFVAFTLLCYAISLLIFDGPKVLNIVVFAVVLGLIITNFINHWIKASIHLATVTSFLLLFGILHKGYYFLLLLLVPLLAWARIRSKEHTPLETLVGTLLGIFLTIAVYTFSRLFLMGMIYN
ncbi:MAG: hypothetical protein HYT07_01920 [Candidatus Levybacteria bacterium]|nr:hypothetical protein [Candidatus Levybacteria bacterium]